MKDIFDNAEDKHAINIIGEFFRMHGLDFAIMDLEQMIYYAAHYKYYKRSPPFTMVFFSQELRKLITASMVLVENCWLQDEFEVEPAAHGLPDLSRKEDFMPDRPLPEWYYMPRHLSVAQYLNPGKTFRQFRKYQTREEWMKTIDDLVEYALSKSTINECNPTYNMMKLRRLLLQLIEGSYLIYIRYSRGVAIKTGSAEASKNENHST
ncbi:MAG: hypothetical protein ABIO32_05945 [Ferruginibacter sp.]